jgi:hypothetical protein
MRGTTSSARCGWRRKWPKRTPSRIDRPNGKRRVIPRAARFQARAAMRLPQLARNALDRDSLPILVALILLLVALSMPAAEACHASPIPTSCSSISRRA